MNRSMLSPLVRNNRTEDPTALCAHFKEDILDEGSDPKDYNWVFTSMLQ